ncbi:MAG: hypothetical protein ACKVTZ_12955 [Bacteroidia bacterium]
MPKLYSYCIPVDDGAAPNPFGECCTLVICKPVIRRIAQVGDWIVGTGSMKFGFQNKVVYAMEVTQKMTMEEYDSYCQLHLPWKIPNFQSENIEERLGDCIYDYSVNPPLIRESRHDEGNRKTDLGGMYALLSNHYYYFGKNPIDLPERLLKIVKQGQGHKSSSNDAYFEEFVTWITAFKKPMNNINTSLYEELLNDKNKCGAKRRCVAEEDEQIGDEC